jgi:adenosylmethionine-8-amino-7-oxononanoate aminotransferase
VQRVIAEEKLLDNVLARGEQLRAALRERYASHPYVGDVRGRGLFVGVELVKDRASKATFDPALKLHAAIKREAFARGLMVYPMGGTVDGRNGDHVLLAPPFICSAQNIDTIVERLAGAIDGALDATGVARPA